MKAHLCAIVIGLVSIATAQIAQDEAQLLSQLPSCALPCLIEGVTASGCSPANSSCICANNTLQANLIDCAQAACNATDLFRSSTINLELCAAVHTESRSSQISRIAITLMCITFPIVGLRVYSRMRFSRRLFEDDWCALISAALLFPTSVIELLGVHKGFGQHLWKIPPETLPNVIEFFYITEILYASPLAFAKISVLLLYLRIFMAPWLRFIAWTTIVCVAASAATTTFVAIFQCIPIESIWNPTLSKRCIDVNTFTVTTATVNTALDVIIIVIPLPELRTLKLHWKRKVGVFVVFLTGSFATATSITRLFFLVNFATSHDSTFDNAPTVIWSAFELNISLICACLPAIRPLLGHYFPNFLDSTDTHTIQSWKGSSLIPPEFGNSYRDNHKRQDKSYQRFIMSSKQGRAKDRVLEEDELELRQYENWI
ncbi:hypothetical protein NA56DRAFT_751260 [Hyaloscypha hepaticicola]|uniref:CFEM domain-containing protein n=1 Tax=Hyaloscypha hepaticicola TaxID=2082293 RepID=A0A2J6PX26_9HELO|nr:hypothetical protein NA56DRAFT_751260 [Hyaloscypha hepaticicola]